MPTIDKTTSDAGRQNHTPTLTVNCKIALTNTDGRVQGYKFCSRKVGSSFSPLWPRADQVCGLCQPINVVNHNWQFTSNRRVETARNAACHLNSYAKSPPHHHCRLVAVWTRRERNGHKPWQSPFQGFGHNTHRRYCARRGYALACMPKSQCFSASLSWNKLIHGCIRCRGHCEMLMIFQKDGHALSQDLLVGATCKHAPNDKSTLCLREYSHDCHSGVSPPVCEPTSFISIWHAYIDHGTTYLLCDQQSAISHLCYKMIKPLMSCFQFLGQFLQES